MNRLERVVVDAERARMGGNEAEAVRIAAHHAFSTEADIEKASPDELRDVMRLWRIWEVSLQSQSQQTANGKEAAMYLRQGQTIIERYFYHPVAWNAALEMKTDTYGNEYQMAAEMCRDEGKLHMYWYNLTLNPRELELSIESFNEAKKLSDEGTSAHALATMEAGLAERAVGKPLQFSEFTDAYKTIVASSTESKNWDRLAAASWMYAREATRQKNRDAAVFGLRNLMYAKKEGDLSVKSYISRLFKAPFLNWSRRRTYSG